MLNVAVSRVIDTLIPNTCGICEKIVGEPATICNECWNGLTFIAGPVCEICGVPFEFEIAEGALCAECNLALPQFEKARSPLLYDDKSKRLITGFKYNDRTHLAGFFTKLLKMTLPKLGEFDMIIPVPLHYLRLVKRRYNQAAIVAESVARGTGKPLSHVVMKRLRRTAPQFGLSRKERAKNVKNAFEVTATGEKLIAGKTILLVDDVLTTGATVGECAKALKHAGVAGVKVLTLSRTPLD